MRYTSTYEKDGKTLVVPARRDERGMNGAQMFGVAHFTERANANAARAARARTNALVHSA